MGKESSSKLWEFCPFPRKAIVCGHDFARSVAVGKVMAKCVGEDIFLPKNHVRRLGLNPRVRGWSSSLIASEQVLEVREMPPYTCFRHSSSLIYAHEY